jgi:hypothetical protein
MTGGAGGGGGGGGGGTTIGATGGVGITTVGADVVEFVAVLMTLSKSWFHLNRSHHVPGTFNERLKKHAFLNTLVIILITYAFTPLRLDS